MDNEKREKAVWHETTPTQKRMYAIHERNPQGLDYNITLAITLKGDFKKIDFISALEKCIRKYKMLRAKFKEINGVIMYSIRDNDYYNIEFEEHYRDESNNLNEFIYEYGKTFLHTYHLENDILYRFRIIKYDEVTTVVFMDFHHIITDGSSIRIMFKEIENAYLGLELAPVTYDFNNFAQWQKNNLQSREYENEKLFWKETLEDSEYTSYAFADGFVDRNKLYPSTLYTLEWGNMKVLKKACNELGCTKFVFIVAVLNATLSLMSRQKDIIIGTVSGGRRSNESSNVFGMLVNTFPIRNQIDFQWSVMEYIAKVKKNVKAALENSDVQYDTIKDMFHNRSDSLFDVSLRYQKTFDNTLNLDGMECHVCEMLPLDCASNFGLFLNEFEDKLEITISFAKEIYKLETVEHFSKLFTRIADEFMKDTAILLAEIELLDTEEKDLILNQFNDTDIEYPRWGTVVDLFEEQVEAAKDDIAVVYKEEEYTYGELDHASNIIAHRLRGMGVGPEDLVVITAEKSFELIAAIIGVLKSGGAYVPIDPSYPQDRIEYMIKDCKPKAILIYGKEAAEKVINLPGIPGIFLEASRDWQGEAGKLTKNNTINHLAYCIYTSGTTGKPKGVLVEHKGILNLREYFADIQSMGKGDRSIQFASISFDAMISEICMSILVGGTMYIVDEETRKDARLFEAFLENNRITAAILPPQFAAAVDLKYIRKIITAGAEAMKDNVIQNANIRRYSNDYGPTENTVCTTHWEYINHQEIQNKVPIGKPIGNVKVYILNENQLCGIGVPGELCISGEGVARGYLNNPELTQKKFVKNPFGEGRLYRSGDLAKWLPDGNIIFLGRIDQQVKIRGFRIELGEIESAIRKIGFIKDAAVIARAEGSLEKAIHAYLVSDEKINIADVRELLSKELPDYMIPAYMLQIAEIPITRNGKLNQKLLPEINLKSEREYVMAQNPIQEEMINIWKDLLCMNKIGIYDNFLELGGHSLLANRLLIRVNQLYGINLKLAQILKHGLTVQELSLLVEDQLLHSIDEVELEELLNEIALSKNDI